MAVQPLQLPPLINVPQLNFAPLDAAGDAIAGYRQRSALADALPGLLGQQPAQPQGNSLATLGQPTQPTAPAGNAASAIGGIESSGNYGAVGPATRTGDRAYGKYQVMGANIPQWTQEVLGRPLTPEQFLASPQAQDAVFNAKFGQYAQKYGPEGAARAWFAGEGNMGNPGVKDQLGTTVADYANKFKLAYNGESPPLPSAITQGAQPATSQPGGASMQPQAATPSQQPASQPQPQAQPQPQLPSQTISGQSIPPQVLAKMQAMIRAGGPAQQFAMAMLQKYVVPQTPVVIGEGGVAVNPVTGQVIARGQPKSYAVAAGGELVTPGASGAGPGGGAGQPSPTYQNTNGLMSDQAVALQAQRAMSGDFSVFSQTGRGNIGQINNGKIIEYMAAHGATPQTLNAAKASLDSQIKATEAFGTGSQGSTVRSLDVSVDHLSVLRNLAQAMNNGDVNSLNSLRNVFREEFGSPLPTNFEAARPIVAAEIVKAITATGGALGDREELMKPLDAAHSWGQLSGVIDNVYVPLMAGQLRGLQRQYEYTTKKTDFLSRLSDRTKAALNPPETPAPKIQKVTSSADANAAIAAAKAAIAQGADPKAVNARLQQMGVPPIAGQ